MGLLFIQYVPIEYRFVAVFGFFLTSYLVSAWALYDGLKGAGWLTIVPLPALYAASVGLFYFLLPEGILARAVLLTLFGLGIYALYLTGNIYSVAAVRTIQLLRAAHAVGFLLTLLTLVLFFNTVFSLKLPFWANGLMVGLLTFPMVLSGLWSILLEDRLSSVILWMSLMVAVVVGEVGVGLSFLPVTVWVASLALVTVVYVALGILQHSLSERLFKRTLQEYVGVGVLVMIAVMAVTQWK